MAVPILFELNQELTRLFVAGSRLAHGDPRIKKFIAPLKKYGEKSPVFLKLAQCIEELIEADANSSAQKLIETEMFLLSVLSTQGDTMPDDAKTSDIAYSEETIGETGISYRALSPVIKALTTSGSGRMEIVQQAFKDGVFNDPRIFKAAVGALGDKYGEIADYMANTVLPSMGEAVYPYLLDGYDLKGGAVDGRRLAVMHVAKGKAVLDLVEETVQDGSAAVKTEAVKIMADYPDKYEEMLLSMLGDKAKAVREEVMKSLVKMNSKAGIDRIMEIYKDKKKSETAWESVCFGDSDYLAGELLQISSAGYEALKSDEVAPEEIKRLKNDIAALKNKRTAEAAEFLKKMLSEEYLAKADKILAKGKSQAYWHFQYKNCEELALDSLYHSGNGDDFIWDMFMDTYKGLIGKLDKSKAKQKSEALMLCIYSFFIGANKLSSEEFYDVFFESGLYKDIAKNDHYAFKTAFLGDTTDEYGYSYGSVNARKYPDNDGKLPQISDEVHKKIVRYFMYEMKDYNHINLVCQMVSPDDPNDIEILDLLAGRLRGELTKNTHGYYNYSVLRLLGKAKHKYFKELYELFREKNHYITAAQSMELDRLERIL